MKVVLTFFALVAVNWLIGTVWCLIAGLRPGGDAQFMLLLCFICPMSAIFTFLITGAGKHSAFWD